MKPLCLLAFLLSSPAMAVPSANVINSCLQAQAQGNVSATEIPTHEIMQEDDYQPGYAANYIEFDGKDIGFATAKKGNAIVFDGKLWPTKLAVVLPGADKVKKPLVHVELADWLMLNEGENQYLCVVDNFDGLGRNGSFQKYRYAYILQTGNKGGLFFSVGKAE
ncbi:hypothetical protein [Paludibacterium sp.]|uniref:hypothetical protein n=1 Tax=Paludibacterium sp. TaxID=1917523 RepID=UPI0025D647DB|nr:hypothetical protein [Paludibacterium sp.]MBV8646082.1 hypothetical protein [Paludibacterium sp.]